MNILSPRVLGRRLDQYLCTSCFLTSDLVTGQVKVGLRSRLPFKGISLLLGSDLAGVKDVSSVYHQSRALRRLLMTLICFPRVQ